MRKAESTLRAELFFQALADRTRLRLLGLMGDREVCVCYFTAALAMSQPKISRHLAYLRRSGLVAARREGKWMHYRIVPPADRLAAQILRDTLDWLARDSQVQRDRGQLEKACCAPQKFVGIKGAPLPVQVG